MLHSFVVRTQHCVGGPFIAAIEVEAESAIEAARDRFARQVKDSQAQTTAVMVTPDRGNGLSAYVFRVCARDVITTSYSVAE